VLGINCQALQSMSQAAHSSSLIILQISKIFPKFDNTGLKQLHKLRAMTVPTDDYITRIC